MSFFFALVVAAAAAILACVSLSFSSLFLLSSFFFPFPFCHHHHHHHQTKNIHNITPAFVRCFANHFPSSWLNLLFTCVVTPKISTQSTSSVALFVCSFPTLPLFNLSPSNLLALLKHFGLKVAHNTTTTTTTTLQHHP